MERLTKKCGAHYELVHAMCQQESCVAASARGAAENVSVHQPKETVGESFTAAAKASCACMSGAMDKLGALEDFLDSELAVLRDATAVLARLKSEEKEKSVQFREVMVKKMTAMNLFIRLKYCGIDMTE